MIRLFNTSTSILDAAQVKEVVKSGFLSEGEIVKRFEEKLASRFNLRNVFTTNSGTSALHLALILAGIKPGDEVILPAQTFIATGLAILYCGAKPVFVDIGQDGNINPYRIEEKITEKTRAVIGVDWAGFPCDRITISQICQLHGLFFIVDAAHSLGAIYINEFVGENQREDFTTFSFQAIKILTTGDGGAVVCQNPEKYERGKRLRWFGIDRDNDLPDDTGERVYNLTEIGYKYHMNDVAAAVGLNQLNVLSQNLTRRRTVAAVYNQKLYDVDWVSLPKYEHGFSSYWLFPIFVDNRNDFIRYMRERGIECGVVHQGIDRNAIFGGTDWTLQYQRLFDARQVNIPVHNSLRDDDVEYIVNAIKMGW